MKFCIRYFYREFDEKQCKWVNVYLERKAGRKKIKKEKYGKGTVETEYFKNMPIYDIVDNVYQSIESLKRYYVAGGIFLNGAKGCDIYKIENEKLILLETVEGLRDL